MILHFIKRNILQLTATFSLLLICSGNSFAQYQPTPNDTLKSISIYSDNTVSFKIFAPLAADVKIGGSDILRNVKMNKSENGVWEGTVGPLMPGAYRYNFIVDKVSVLDPKNPMTSESFMNTWSLFYLQGADFMETKDVPHGSISELTYFSKSLNRNRRLHVYTPPGYEAGNDKYPIFYLLHGAFDCDDSWTSVGRAGFILDNLIASKKAVPMVVVMPAGHTGPFSFGAPRDPSKPRVDEFLVDFNNDIKPLVESRFRVKTERHNRAIAGLSMGGAQTLNIAVPSLSEFSYFGVFSSGVFGITGQGFGADSGPSWEDQNKEMLANNELKKDLRLVWFATGKEDFLLETSRATVNLFKKYGFNVTYKETKGAHTWENWREYLNEFAQLLFK